jgi:hypothetical protein
VVLVKRILLFLLSIVFLIFLLIGATTSYAKDEFNSETIETKNRLYTIEWIDIADEYGKKFVCGTRVSIFDFSGRKYIFEYYYLLKNNNKIVTRFDVNALQISVLSYEPIKTEKFEIKLFGSIIIKNDKNILAGMRGNDSDYKGVGAEYTELNLTKNIELFEILYKGEYNLNIYMLPKISTTIPVAKNTLHKASSEKILLKCVKELLENYEYKKKPKGEVFIEDAMNVGLL